MVVGFYKLPSCVLFLEIFFNRIGSLVVGDIESWFKFFGFQVLLHFIEGFENGFIVEVSDRVGQYINWIVCIRNKIVLVSIKSNGPKCAFGISVHHTRMFSARAT